MKVQTESLRIKSTKENEVIDLSEEVQNIVRNSKITNGIVTIFVKGSTGALTTIEFEPGLIQDFHQALSRIAPDEIEYAHEAMWHDGNGRSHVKASLIGPSLNVPIINGDLSLGTWQQIDFFGIRYQRKNKRFGFTDLRRVKWLRLAGT